MQPAGNVDGTDLATQFREARIDFRLEAVRTVGGRIILVAVDAAFGHARRVERRQHGSSWLAHRYFAMRVYDAEAKLDVRSSPCHVGGDGDVAQSGLVRTVSRERSLARLGDNVRFAGVVLGI